MQKLSNFFIKSTSIISESTLASIQDLTQDIDKINQQPLKIDQSPFDQPIKTSTDHVLEPVTSNDIVEIIPLTVDKISIQKPLENIKLEQSNIIQLESKLSSQPHLLKKSQSENASFKQSISTSRIKQIQEQKKRILEELKRLDEEIVEIKKENNDSLQKSRFVKKVEISDDIEAKRQAQSLIKQLHLQKKKIQEKKRRQQEKELQERKKQQEEKKRESQEMQKRIKEQKRQLIEKRMEEQKKKKEQRRLVEKQSNLLIQELKKQQKLEKERELIPGQILEYELKRKLLEKKQLFNISQIEQHEQNYRQLKSKEKQLKRERSSSIKLSYPIPKFVKNIWGEKLEQQQMKKKEEQKLKQLGRKMQLQKRMKYGDIVKNILKSKQKKKQESIEKPSKDQSFHQSQTVTMKKPQTPDVNSHLPKIQNTELKRQNKTDKTFKQRNQSNIIIGEKKSRVASNSKQHPKERDPEQLQKIQKQKQRQLQLRKQTKQRLKKLQTKSIDIPKPQKVKYENYIGQVKIKKAGPQEEWKKIMQNEKLSKEQKYKQMLSKAAYMENQARIKEDLRKNGDEDAVNLYIGSIQAKLALLQKF